MIFSFPNKRYHIIYADPPWQYNNKNVNGGVIHHYNSLNYEVIKNLPIKDISEDNCILFLWITFPQLPNALEVMKCWGFKYKTLGFSWIKTNKKNDKPFFGIGYYTRSNCEVCLIGIKGKPKMISKSISSVIISPREKHSKKPDIIRNKIIELCGDISRIELFAREQANGWDAWGDEIK